MAAVSVCVAPEDGHWWLLVIRRSQGLRTHPGQFAFPGGGREAGDESLWDTARRETLEEVGLRLQADECLGPLQPVQVRVSGYTIVPWLVKLSTRPECSPNQAEVQSIHWISDSVLRAGAKIGPGGPVYDCPDGVVIWGATARIVQQLRGRRAPC